MREWLTEARKKETYEEYRKAVLYGISEEVTRFFEDDAPDKFGFEQRPGQLDMSYDILDALRNNRHIAVEAGVGIGKSFAYLLPMLLYSEYMDKPVIIATSTIALQEQLRGDVERIQALLGFRREIVLAKGQTHYLCRERAARYLSGADSGVDAEQKKKIQAEIENGCEERKQFTFPISNEVWQEINVVRYGGENCKTCKRPCLYAKIRERLKATRGMILCNQDLLTAHLIRRKRRQERLITSLADVVVVDEAHNLESKVRNALTERLTCEDLYKALDAVPGELADPDRPLIRNAVSGAKQAAFAFFQNLYGQMREQVEQEQRDALDTERFFFTADAVSLALLYDLSKSVHQLSDRVAELSGNSAEKPSGDSRRVQAGPAALSGMAGLLENLYQYFEDKLVWIERTPNGAGLVCCPKETAHAVQELYFKGRFRTILTSATLTNTRLGELSEQYGYFVRNTGFPIGSVPAVTDGDGGPRLEIVGGVLAEPKPSPFPYDRHAMLYYCGDLPHPTREHDAFIRKGAKRLTEILNISHGKALVLFTSKADMEDVYAILREKNLPYRVLKQEDGPSDAVRQTFQADMDSVLLATGYWEGISIEGRSLSNLVIFRLPFPAPDPVMDAKASTAADPLMEVQVPEMVIRLKQGVGRLIRGFSDKGIVSILDPRLRDCPPARYRDTVWAAMPVQNRTNSVRNLEKFYKVLEKG